MKTKEELAQLLAAAGMTSFIALSNALAANHTVTIEGPVKIVSSKTSPGKPVYIVERQGAEPYRILIPDAERGKFVSVLKKGPLTIVRFDGAIVDDEEGQAIKVSKWEAVQTSITSDEESRHSTAVRKET